MSDLSVPVIHRLSLMVTGVLLVGLLLLGTSLQLGWRRDLVRWPHHALFFAVCMGLILCVVLSWRAGRPWWALLPAQGLLLSMPLTRPGRADHWRRALLSTAAFLSALAWVW